MKEYLNVTIVQIDFKKNLFNYNNVIVKKVNNNSLQVLSISGKLGNKGRTTLLYEVQNSKEYYQELTKSIDLAKKHINAKKKQGFISKSFLEKTLSKGQLKLCDECGEEIDPIFYKKINEWGRNEGGWDNSTKCVGYQKVLCIPCQIEHKLYKKKLNQRTSK